MKGLGDQQRRRLRAAARLAQPREGMALLEPGSGAIWWKVELWQGPWVPSGAGAMEGGTAATPEPAQGPELQDVTESQWHRWGRSLTLSDSQPSAHFTL